MKMKIDPNHELAICFFTDLGPTFGNDIYIANNANTKMDSISDLSFDYKHPKYKRETNEAKTFLAGSFHFQLDEIEVYQKE